VLLLDKATRNSVVTLRDGAPVWRAIHLFVKRQYERGPRHFLGPAQGTFELVEFQPPR
jgi:hypothetical protein